MCWQASNEYEIIFFEKDLEASENKTMLSAVPYNPNLVFVNLKGGTLS